VEYHHALPNDETVKHPPDAFPPAGPQLEKTASHSSRVRHAEIGAELHQKLQNPCKISQYAVRPVFDLTFDAWMKVLDAEVYKCHVSNFANFYQLYSGAGTSLFDSVSSACSSEAGERKKRIQVSGFRTQESGIRNESFIPHSEFRNPQLENE